MSNRTAKRLDDPMLSNRAFAIFFIVTVLIAIGLLLAPKVHAASGTWNVNADTIWSTPGNWVGNIIADGAGATGNFTFNITTGGGRTITIDGAVASRTLGIMNIGDTDASSPYIIAASGGGTLTFDNGGSNAQLNQTSTSKGDTISAPILLKSSLDITNASALILTISGTIGSSATSGTQTVSLLSGDAIITGVISNGVTGGTVALAKSGSGTLTLNNATNTYSGGTSINSGTILFNNRDSLGTGTVTLGTSGGGNATLTSTTGLTLIPNNIVVAAGSGGTLTLGSTSTAAGSYSGTLTLNGNLSLTSATTAAGAALTFSNTISGVGALTKIGAGVATLSGNNTYSGGTIVSAGTLQLGSNGVVSGGLISTGPVGTGTLTLGGGVTLRSSGLTARTIQNNLSLSGSITLGDATNTGLLTFNSTDGTNTLTTPATVTLTGNTTLTTNSAVTIVDVISGGFSLTKAGTSTLTFSGANTYSGGTVVNNGTLTVDTGGTLGASTGALAVNTAGGITSVLNLNVDQTVGSLSGTVGGGGTATINIASTKTLTSDQSTNTIYAGVLASAGGLTKAGAGTLTLTGNNSFTGTTTVNGGTLEISNTNNASSGRISGTSGITVNSGGTLLFSGSSSWTDRINDSATMTLNGGTFNTGGLTERTGTTLGIGALTLTATSTINFGSSNTSLIRFAGLGTHTDTTVLQITNWNGNPNTGGSGDQLLFIGTTSSFTSLYDQDEVSFNGAFGYNIYQFTGFYEVTAVPEPSTWGAGALAIASLVVIQRRRISRFLKRRT